MATEFDAYERMMQGTFGGTFEGRPGSEAVRLGLSQPPVVDSPDTGLGVGVRAGMMRDPQAQLRAYATARFPNLPEHEALGRYGFVGGDIVYRGYDGQLYREDSPVGSFIGDAGPAVAGAMAGLALTPPPAAPLGAAIGGVLGATAKRTGAVLQGDTPDPLGDVKEFGTEALLNWGGAKLGDLAGRYFNRRAVSDLERIDWGASNRLMELAKARGVTLTPAEATDLGSLIQRQTRLGMGFDEAGDIMRRFYGDRAEKIGQVVNDFIGATPGQMAAGEAAASAGRGIIESAKAARSRAVRPTYKELMRPENVVPSEALQAELKADPYLQGVIDTVKRDPLWVTDEGINISRMPDNSLPVLDRAKKLLDSEIQQAERSGDRARMRMLEQRRQTLVQAADDAFPEYAQVRAEFAGLSPDIKAMEEGLLGQVAKFKGTRVDRAAKTMLDESLDPARISDARTRFYRAGRAKEWDDLVNVWLQLQWSKANTGRSVKDIAGAKFREQVFGTPQRQAMLREALGTERYRDFRDLMDVLEATGRVPRGQSMTQPAQEAAKREAVEAAPVATGLRNLEITDPLGELREWWIGAKTEDWRRTLADIITSDDAMKEMAKLRYLRELPPTSRKRLEATALALSRAGVLSAPSVSARPPDRVPPEAPPQPQVPQMP